MSRASLRHRLGRVEDRLRPVACRSPGPRCRQTMLVGDGSADPPVPPLPPVCAGCGRPIRWQLVVLPGTDVARL